MLRETCIKVKKQRKMEVVSKSNAEVSKVSILKTRSIKLFV